MYLKIKRNEYSISTKSGCDYNTLRSNKTSMEELKKEGEGIRRSTFKAIFATE